MKASEILQKLNPIVQGNPQETIFGIWLYIFFFMVLIALFRQDSSKPNPATLYMLVASLLFALIDKVALGTSVLPRAGMGTFFMRAAMFILPLLGVAVAKSPKGRGWGIIGFVIGASYFLIRGITDFGFFRQ